MSKSNSKSIVVISSNACLHSSAQVESLASFLSKQNADIMFIQEANGYIGELLDQLHSKPGFEETVLDITTHILLRRGYFHKLTEEWPRRFYSKAYLPESDTNVILLNLHLCEHKWKTDSDEEERKYRVQYLENILKHIQTLQNVSQTPIIIGGDFNSFSHQDQSLYVSETATTPALNGNNKLLLEPFSQLVYKGIYKRQIFSTLILVQAGLTDCWRNCHPGSRLILENKEEPFISWPVSHESIKHNKNLQHEIEKCEVAGRIDYIFVNSNVKIISCQMMHEPIGWYSDHYAVVALLRIGQLSQTHIQIDKKILTKTVISNIMPSIAVCLVLPSITDKSTSPQWLLSASALSGSKNHYIEIVHCTKDTTDVNSLGWFYVDGLQDIQECPIEESLKYMYSSFDPLKLIDPRNVHFEARLYNDRQEELRRTKVQIRLHFHA
jgi:exonuclease III